MKDRGHILAAPAAGRMATCARAIRVRTLGQPTVPVFTALTVSTFTATTTTTTPVGVR